MRQVFITAALLIFCVTACKKDNVNNYILGLYTENSPFAGRSQLNFISGNLVIRSEPGSSYRDTFYYSISSDKILLTPAWTDEYSGQPLDFEKIDDTTIKIENLYPSIPEAPKSYMTYKK